MTLAHRARRLARLGVVAGALVCCGGADAEAPKPVTHTVTIDSTRFSPESVTVTSGDIVIWVNKDVIPHTATSKTGGFDSGTIASGDSWKHTVTGQGEFTYTCIFHPTMKGRMIVKSGAK